MRIILHILLFSISFMSVAQEQKGDFDGVTNGIGQKSRALHIGVSSSIEHSIGARFSYFASDFQLGLQFDVMSGYLKTYGAYQLFGNKAKEPFGAYMFASHLIGAGIEYQSNREKVVSLIVGVSLMTEVYTNFKNGYMNEGDLAMPSIVRSYEYNYYAPHSKEKYRYYEAYHYQGTPLSASIWLGANFKVFKIFNVSLSIVNDVRIMSKKYFKWDMIDDEPDQVNLVGKDMNELIDNEPTSRTVIDQFGLRIGLSYTLPLSKKK